MFKIDDIHESLKRIREDFLRNPDEAWVSDRKLKSWSLQLGIHLNVNGDLDYNGLFSLFVLAILWNNKPTFKVLGGAETFKKIAGDYSLENFRLGKKDSSIYFRLK